MCFQNINYFVHLSGTVILLNSSLILLSTVNRRTEHPLRKPIKILHGQFRLNARSVVGLSKIIPNEIGERALSYSFGNVIGYLHWYNLKATHKNRIWWETLKVTVLRITREGVVGETWRHIEFRGAIFSLAASNIIILSFISTLFYSFWYHHKHKQV